MLLAIFLGDFGAHNFYLGQFVRGAAHVLLLTASVGILLYGNSLGRSGPLVAGIPAGTEFYLLGLVILAANGLWRWVEFIVIVSTPQHGRGR